MKYFRTVMAWVLGIFWTALVAAVAFVAAFVDRRGVVWWPASRLWARVLLTTGVTRLRLVGAERMAAMRGVVFMANHQSHFDPPALIAVSERPWFFLTKKELAYFPIFGWALWMVGHIFIDRKNPKRARASIARAAAKIAAGKNVVIFPEGTRAVGEQLLPFKKGGFVLAIQGGVPIVPVGIAGTREVLPKGWRWMGSGPVTIVVGEPIDTSGYAMEDKEALMALVHQRIVALRERAYSLNEPEDAERLAEAVRSG